MRAWASRRGGPPADDGKTGIFMTTDMMTRTIEEKLRIPLTSQPSLFGEEYFKAKGEALRGVAGLPTPRPFANLVTGLSASEVEVNDVVFACSVLLTARHQFVWNAPRFDQLTPGDFRLLEVLNPPPSYLLVSTGAETRALPDPVRAFLASFGVKVDAVKNFYAASVFNSCIEREVDIVAFFHVER